MVEKALLDRTLKRITKSGLRVTYWDGDSRIYGEYTKPVLGITLKDKKIVKEMAKNPSLAVGEAYMDGNLLVEGPLDLLAEVAYLNPQIFDLKGASRAFRGHNANRKAKQQKNISYHYDLGNDFYKLWLDRETFGYSCSYYKTPKDTLEDGQRQKFDHVLKKLQLSNSRELLDIGFGWGYLLIRAAKVYGVKGLGVSLSKEQHTYAQAWAKREKVDHLVTFKLMNYQDLPKLKRKFDRIVSIGFFEHVGKYDQANYFKLVDRLLADDGLSVLHTITQQKTEESDPWLDRYIFPGGYIPSISSVNILLADSGFVLKDYENIGPHYIKTCQQWWDRFEKHKEEIIGKYGERFYRMWRFYLASCVGGFRAGDISLSQFVFTRVPGNDWPLTREHIYK